MKRFLKKSNFLTKVWLRAQKIPIWKALTIGIISLLLFCGTATVLFVFVVRQGYFGVLPAYGDLKNIQNNIASEIYSADGELLGKYFIQERTHTNKKDISPHLIHALIATEDVRFYEHKGIDYKSLGRVLVKSILLQKESSGGGSTITQQLAKNLYPRQNHGILTIPVNKVREALIARRLEKIYDKEQILELYLNTVSFGDNAFGIETAAERYFNIDPDELTLPQAALLVGMLKATYNYNPRLHPESAIARRNLVLSQMTKYGYLTPESADSLKAAPLDLKYTNKSHSEGLAAYFREYLRIELTRLLQQIEKPDGGAYNVYTDGLKIYTTIDSRLQEYAEEAMREHMSQLHKTFVKHWNKRPLPWEVNNNILKDAVFRSERYKRLKAEGLVEEEIREEFDKKYPMKVFEWDGEKEITMSPLDSVKHYLKFLNAGFLAMDPKSGDIKVWVGGVNHKYFKYDHVNLRTKRQAGSTFKPIVYAAALEQGLDPCEYHANELKVYEEYENWTPQNSDGKYEGFYSMQGALVNSVNTVSVDLVLQAGIENAVSFAHNIGIQSKIEQVPGIALGTPSVSLYEMVAAYGAFINKGQTVKPRFLAKVETRDGKTIYENNTNGAGKQAMSERTAAIMLEMMQGVVNQGTGARLRYKYGLYHDIAGKTGTTQDQADGWFIGITPNLVAGSWVGSDDPRIHFRSLELGQGAATALPIYGLFMQKAIRDKNFKTTLASNIPEPGPEILAALDCQPFKERLEIESVFEVLEKMFKRDDRPAPKYPKTDTRKKKKNFFERLFGR